MTETLIAALTTMSLALNLVVTAILVWTAVTHRRIGVLRERAGIAMGLTALYLLGYILLLGRDGLDQTGLYIVGLLMILSLSVPQAYFLYLYVTRRW